MGRDAWNRASIVVSLAAAVLCGIVAFRISDVRDRMNLFIAATQQRDPQMQKYESTVTGDSGLVTTVITERRVNADGSDEDVTAWAARHAEAVTAAKLL